METAGKNISATNNSSRSSLAFGKQVIECIYDDFLTKGDFQVWTIEGGSEDEDSGECGGGGGKIELKLTSCGKGFQFLFFFLSKCHILHFMLL